MEFGAHLPLIAFSDEPPSLQDLTEYTRVARDAGFSYLCANDHLVFSRPWLDAPTAIAAVLPQSGQMRLVTTVALPVVRGPAPTAKWLAALDVLSEGRVIAGVGPGSSPRDYALAGVPWEQRWERLDEAIGAMRALWRGDRYEGQHYGVDGSQFEPSHNRRGGPPVWVGSWGSPAGLRRVARRADGWLASGYNTTPERFEASYLYLRQQLEAMDRDAARFRNAVATMWTYVTDDAAEADRILREVLAPVINRDPEELRERLLIGPAELCAERIADYAAAGAQRMFIWPVADPILQLERFQQEVRPLAIAG